MFSPAPVWRGKPDSTASHCHSRLSSTPLSCPQISSPSPCQCHGAAVFFVPTRSSISHQSPPFVSDRSSCAQQCVSLHMLSADGVPVPRQILSPDSVSYWEPANSLLHLSWQSWRIPCHPSDSYDDFPMTFGDLRVINYCYRMSRGSWTRKRFEKFNCKAVKKFITLCSFLSIFIITNLVFFLSISQMHSSLLALESARNAECIRFNLVRELMMLLADIVVNDENAICTQLKYLKNAGELMMWKPANSVRWARWFCYVAMTIFWCEILLEEFYYEIIFTLGYR